MKAAISSIFDLSGTLDNENACSGVVKRETDHRKKRRLGRSDRAFSLPVESSLAVFNKMLDDLRLSASVFSGRYERPAREMHAEQYYFLAVKAFALYEMGEFEKA